MQQVTLYHVPPSFYSQIARLALTEAGIEYKERIIIPGPPGYESYSPDYMRLNPNGTVPTLVVADLILDDSRDIIDWIAAQSLKNHLVPRDAAQAALMVQWIDRAYGLSERELAYSSGMLKYLGRFINGKRIKALKRFAATQPDMAAIYDAKIADIEDMIAKAADTAHIAALTQRFDDELDALDAVLTRSIYVAGDHYSLADICWTVTVTRHQMLKKAPLQGRANLARWLAQMKKRPSYLAAGVMDGFSFAPIRKVLASRMKKQPAIAARSTGTMHLLS